MKVSDIGEFGLIARVTTNAVVRKDDVICGIGDDCAVTRGTSGLLRLLTTDLLVERVHFLREAIPPRQLGAKALAVNLSDIAAMGGRPRDAYVSIAIPKGIPLEYLDQVFGGFKDMAARFEVNLLGGDTTASKADLVINVALTGEVDDQHILYRSGAQPGDTLFVTGCLGDSAAGLDAILRERGTESGDARELVRRHHEPEPHVVAGQAIAATARAHAMIDVSDGLASDLGHVCDRSGVGVEVLESAIPLSPELQAYAAAHDTDAHAMGLVGGEDYVLLVAGDRRLPQALAGAGIDLYPIGQVVEGGRREIIRRDGSRVPLSPTGWDHFRSQM